MTLRNISNNKYFIPALIVLAYSIMYCLLSLVNHYNFRTHALDLAIHNQSMFDYSHFRWNDNPIMNKSNILADHFSLYPLIFSPLVWLFGSYTLLLVQIAFVILGGIGFYKVVEKNFESRLILNLALVFFYSMWAIYSALSFDYHEVVLSAMAVPWLFYFYSKKNIKGICFVFLFVLIGKENMALWGFFLMLGFAWLNFKEKKLRNLSLILACASVAYFLLIMNVVMPALFDDGRGYLHFHYPDLGESPKEALITIVTKPYYSLKLLFVNTSGHESWNGIKAELHYVVLFSGGVFLLLKPQYLLMLVPIYAQKMFHYDMGKWGINSHYSIEFVPILSMATFHFIKEMKNEKYKKILSIVLVLSCISITFSKLEYRRSKWYNKNQSQFYSNKHYKTNYDPESIRKGLALIPKDARVCAQENLCPHLAFRDVIDVITKCENPEYVIFFLTSESIYPIRSKELYVKEYNKYKDDEHWEDFYSDKDLTIFKLITYDAE